MNKNILTIAVPFRLSLEDLNTCLESIEKQFENPKIMEPIEVLVSCNSMDKDVCKDFDLFMGRNSLHSFLYIPHLGSATTIISDGWYIILVVST